MWLGSRIWPRGISYSTSIYRYRLWYHGMMAANACLYGNTVVNWKSIHLISSWKRVNEKLHQFKLMHVVYEKGNLPKQKISSLVQNHFTGNDTLTAESIIIFPFSWPYYYCQIRTASFSLEPPCSVTFIKRKLKLVLSFSLTDVIFCLNPQNSYFSTKCNNSFESTSYYWQQT